MLWLPSKALRDFDESLRIDAARVETHFRRGALLIEKKQYLPALGDFEDAVRLDPNCPEWAMNEALFLATCLDDFIRDGKKALSLAQKACELTKWKDAGALDVLAAAHAEMGDFEQAVRRQAKALEDKEFAANSGDAARKRLELYKQKKPCRDD